MIIVGILSLVIWFLFYLTAHSEHDRQDATVLGVALLTFYTISLTVICNVVILPLLSSARS